MRGFDTIKKPDAAAIRIGVVSYWTSFVKTAISSARMRGSTRSRTSTSIQHLRSEITRAASLQDYWRPLCFRLLTRRLLSPPELAIVTRSTTSVPPVYTEVA